MKKTFCYFLSLFFILAISVSCSELRNTIIPKTTESIDRQTDLTISDAKEYYEKTLLPEYINDQSKAFDKASNKFTNRALIWRLAAKSTEKDGLISVPFEFNANNPTISISGSDYASKPINKAVFYRDEKGQIQVMLVNMLPDKEYLLIRELVCNEAYFSFPEECLH